VTGCVAGALLAAAGRAAAVNPWRATRLKARDEG
jgi:hypothetical protein